MAYSNHTHPLSKEIKQKQKVVLYANTWAKCNTKKDRMVLDG